MRRDRRPLLLALPPLLLVGAFFVAPLLLLIRVSLYAGGGNSGFGIGGFYQPGTWSAAAYARLLTDGYFAELLGFTLQLGFITAIISAGLGLALALMIARLPPVARNLTLGLVILPKLANVLVVVYGLELLLSNIGPINSALLVLGIVEHPVRLFHNFAGTLIGEVYLILPYDVLILTIALGRIEPLLRPAARGLGAGAWRTFVHVTLPLIRPSIVVAFLLSLIFALGAFVSPYLLGSPDQYTLAIDIQRQAFENSNWPIAAAEAVLMLLAILLLYVGSGKVALRPQ